MYFKDRLINKEVAIEKERTIIPLGTVVMSSGMQEGGLLKVFCCCCGWFMVGK